jgi:hypothetical protein
MQLLIRYTLALDPLGTWWADSTPFQLAGWEDATVADIDNFSQEEVLNPILQMAREADALFLYFHVKDADAPLGSLMPLLDEISRLKGKEIKYEVHGQHTGVEKMLASFL